MRLVLIAAAAAGIIGAFGGWRFRDALCDEAAARAEVSRLSQELAAAKAAAESAAAHARALDVERNRLQTEVEDYAEDLRARPTPRCTLDRRDLDRLLRIGAPRGSEGPPNGAALLGARRSSEPAHGR